MTTKNKIKNGMVVINEIHSFVVNKKKSYIDFKQTQPCLIIIIIIIILIKKENPTVSFLSFSKKKKKKKKMKKRQNPSSQHFPSPFH